MTNESTTNEPTIHYMSGHGTWAEGEDIVTLCGRNYVRKNGFPGYWKGAKVITLSKKTGVTEIASRVNCGKCKVEIKVSQKAQRPALDNQRKLEKAL